MTSIATKKAQLRRRLRYTTATDGELLAILYARVSKAEMARDGLSLKRQPKECLEYVGRHAEDGWTVGEQFADVQSGKRDDRPEYQRMLLVVRGHALAGRRVAIIVQDFDRLGRNLRERCKVWEELTELGVEIHSLRHGGVVTEFIYNIYATIAQEEARKIGERQWGIIQGLQDAGWHKSGSAAWGYSWRERTPEEQAAGAPASVLVPNDDEAPSVRSAFEKRAAGMSVRQVALWAAALPAVERGNRALNFAAIQKILAAPVYVSRHGTSYDDDPLGPVLDRPAARWEPLVSDEVYARCRQRDADHQKMPRQASGAYALTGLLFCWVCGCRMSGRPRHAQQGRYRRGREYFCSSSLLGATAAGAGVGGKRCYATVNADVIEHAVLVPMRELLTVASDVRVHDLIRRAVERQERRSSKDDPATRRERLLREREAVRRALGELTVKMTRGTIDDEEYQAAREQLQDDRARLDREIADVGAVQARPSHLEDIAALLSGVAGWAHAFELADPLALRSALGALVERIEPVRVARGTYRAAIKYTAIGLRLLEVRRELAELEGDERFMLETIAVAGPCDVVTGVDVSGVDHAASVRWSTPDISAVAPACPPVAPSSRSAPPTPHASRTAAS
jgi:site-specific DNA recombinase